MTHSSSHFWGIDLGGTKIEGVVLPSLTSPQPLARIRIQTEQEKGYGHIISQVARLIEALQREVGFSPTQIGFGTPGTLDPFSGCLKNSNTQCLLGKPLQRDLEGILKVPCVLANDANCFALAESIFGAGRNHKVVFGVIMGTGVGGGIVVDGKVLSGVHGIAGEWGHNVLNPEGPLCYCKKRGCVETMISGPALEAWYDAQSGNKRTLAQIINLAHTSPGGKESELLTHLLTWFGRALAVVVNILDPDVIVLGGGLSNISELTNEGHREVSRYVFNDSFQTRIVQNELGDSAGVFGAALLTKENC